MAISLKPQYLKRYRDLARLLMRYGRSDLIRGSGLDRLELDEPRGDGARGKVATMAQPTPEASGEVLAEARNLAADLEALGPTYVKVGQFLSTRADLLPLPYLEQLARLQDKLAPFSFAEVERTVSEELGVRMSKAFSYFDHEPVAAASLGQVHRAELRSGQAVAVKVQRPGVRDQILQDLEVLADIAGFLDRHTEAGRRYAFEATLEEFRKSLLRELDYRQEARNLTRIGEHLADFELIVVPSPVDDYVTSRVLTMEFIRGRKVTSLSPLARMEINGPVLAEALCRAYLQQVLVDGLFHADPHPGNIFLTEDGRVALLDLGMVGQMPAGFQETLLKLVLAIAEGRGEDAAGLSIRMSEPQPGFDEKGVRRRIAELVTRTHGLTVQEAEIGRIFFEVARIAADGNVRVPRELTLLGKTLLNIDQVARGLDPDFDANASIRRNAADILRDRMLTSLSPGKLVSGMLEVKEFAEKLPARVNSLIDAVVENRLRIKVDAIDQVLLMEGLQKVANRITVGLVICALIIGAAMLMRVETNFRIFGYPGLAILFFLAAGISALVLIFNILHSDLRGKKERVLSLPGPQSGEGKN